MKSFSTILLLTIANIFMTFAWYGHLKFKETTWAKDMGLASIILLSWGIALFEYMFQVPANKLGYHGDGGPFQLVELKILQEVISLSVFSAITLLVFKTEKLAWNHLAAFVLIVAAVVLVFKKG